MKVEALLPTLLFYFVLFKFVPILDHLLILFLITLFVFTCSILLISKPKWKAYGYGILAGIGITAFISVTLLTTYYLTVK